MVLKMSKLRSSSRHYGSAECFSASSAVFLSTVTFRYINCHSLKNSLYKGLQVGVAGRMSEGLRIFNLVFLGSDIPVPLGT